MISVSLKSSTTTQPRTLLELIGNTPLIALHRIAPDLPPGVELLAKAEWYNPGGSIKDRAAYAMILDGQRRGLLRRGMRIADATSGNTGIAYATVGAALGYQVTLAIPSNASPERKRILRALGAELILTDPLGGMDLAIETIRARIAEDPDHYFYPDQYNNAANAQAHYDTTGPEIWNQTDGKVTHFVAALGTSGTFMGAGRRLRKYSRDVQLVAVQPDGPYHGIEGIKHMATTLIVPSLYDPAFADETLEVTTETAYAMARKLATTEGLLVGISAAANVAAAITVARRLTSGVVVTVLCDNASKYLSEHFWDATPVEGVAGEGI